MVQGGSRLLVNLILEGRNVQVRTPWGGKKAIDITVQSVEIQLLKGLNVEAGPHAKSGVGENIG